MTVETDIAALTEAVEVTYPDRSPGDKKHQEDHDRLHRVMRALVEAGADQDELIAILTALLSGAYPLASAVTQAITGRYATNGTPTQTQAITAGWAYWAPVILRSGAWDRIGLDVTAAGAGGTLARVALYEDDKVGGGPGSVLLDAGTLATSAVAFVQATISLNLASTRKLWAWVTFNGAPTVRAANNNPLVSVSAGGTARAALFSTGRAADVAGGAPTPASWVAGDAGTAPVIYVRRG